MPQANVSHFLVPLGRTSLEAGVLVVLVLATQWLFRRQLTPRWRCALWWLVAVRLLLPFSFSSAVSVFNLLPSWAGPETSGPAEMDSMATSTAVYRAPNFPAGNRSATTLNQNPARVATPTASAPAKGVWPWPDWLFASWLAGALLLAGHVAVSSLCLWRRCAAMQPLTQPEALAGLRECCARLRLRRQPVLLESAGVGSPALHGLFRPRLLLPKGFTAKFSPAELRFVFLHELAHLKRRDLLMNWVVAALQVAHWFNPLVWFGFARWRAERELACDAMALEAAGAGQNRDYGRTILRLLDNFARPPATPGLVGILEDKRQLRRRIGMIASYVPTRGWPGLAVLLMGVLAGIGLTDAQTKSLPATNAYPPPDRAPGSVEFQTSLNTSQPKGSEMNTSSMTNPIARAAAIGLLALAAPATSTVARAADGPAAPAAPELANQLIGAWVLVGTPDHVRKAPAAGGRIKFFTGSHWCMTQADAKSGVVLFHHGGTYTLDGNVYHETMEFANPSTMSDLGRTNGHFHIKIEGDTLTDIGIDNGWKEVWKRLKPSTSVTASPLAQGLTGTWVYAGKPGATNAAPADDQRLKFCADGRWCDTLADPKNGVVVIHHGGIYSLKGDKYVETCQYGNPTSMPLIGHDAKFTIKLEGDTLTLIGINNPWQEVWKRLD